MSEKENISKEITKEVKEESEIFKNDDDILDSDNMDLDNLLTLGFNFDMLKLIISNIIKNQHKINFQLADLKLDKINKEKRADELESMIIDLKILKEDSNQIKKDLQEQKKKLSSKEYQKEIATILKEKGYFSETLDNLNKSTGLNNKNRNYLLKFKDLYKKGEKMNKSEDYINNNILSRMKDEININNENFKKEINNELNSQLNNIREKFDEVKSKMISNEKDFMLMKKTVKNTEEKMDIKFTQDMPKLIERIFYSKITSIDSKVMNMSDEFEKNLNKFKEDVIKDINEIQKNIQGKKEDFDKKINDLQNTDKNILEKINILYNEKLNEFLKFKDFKDYQMEIEGKILYESKQLNIEISKLKNSLKKLKDEYTDFVSDKTDHNNLNSLIKKFEVISAIAFRTQETQEEFEKEKKRLKNFDPKKFVVLDSYEDFKNNVIKVFSQVQKDFQDVKNELMEINAKSLGNKASIRDLRSLEDNFIMKIDELFNLVKEKFAEKNMVLKNNKVIELKVKHLIEENKKSEKNDTWLLSKKPIGHLCASCESYIGDLKDESTNTKYIPWNKYPTKDPNDKLYRVGAGFSKMLKLVSPESHRNKIKNFPSKEFSTPNMEEETNSNLEKEKLINNSINCENNSVIQMDNEINSIKSQLPNLFKVRGFKKNMTFTSFYSNDNSKENNKNKPINKTGIHFSNLIVNNMNKNNKNMKIINLDLDKDEIINLPNSPQYHNRIFSYEDQKGPKIMKIYKKNANDKNENRNRKIISIKDKIIN